MRTKFTILICDDSEQERMRFYERQYDNFNIYGVTKTEQGFVEYDKVDSPEKLDQTLMRLIEQNRMPDLVLLDLFYKKPIPNSAQVEREFITKITTFKDDFRKLKMLAQSYLIPSGIDVIKKLRRVDKIPKDRLPIYVYTDKNFNLLPSAEFNALYELNPGFLYKDRDDDEPRSQIPASSEYFRLLDAIENPRKGQSNGSVFISHGHGSDWMQVQLFIEKDLKINTIELGQVAMPGLPIIQALEDVSKLCSFAVIVMTGDDIHEGEAPRARENVMHEIGYFQGKYGLDRVCIVYEDGTSIPTNLSGVLYLKFAKGHIQEVFSKLAQRLSAA